MKQRVEKCMDCFKDHKATLVMDTDEIMVIDWRNKNGCGNYYVRYIINKKFYGNIIVVGDLGDAVFQTFWNPDELSIERISRLIPENNIDYLVGKLACSSDKYEYDQNLFESDVREHLYYDDLNYEDKLEVNKIILDLLYYLHPRNGLQNADIEDIEGFDEDYWEWLYDAGEIIATRPILWITGLIMACRQLDGE